MPPKFQTPCSFYPTNSCKKGSKCPYSHVNAYQPSPPRVVCKHFKSGKCMFGERCRDIHDPSPALSSITPKAPHCVFWKSGQCSKGEECSFLHDSLISPAVHTSPEEKPPGTTTLRVTGKTPCKFWGSGCCSQGDQCKFLHEPLTARSDTTSWRERQVHSVSPPPAFGRELGSRPIDIVSDYQERVSPSSRAQIPSDHGEADDEHSEKLLDGRTAPSLIEGGGSSHMTGSLEETMIERTFLDSTRALVGPGGTIQKVITAFESHRVTLSNFPEDSTHEEIMTMAEEFGPLKSVVLNPSTPGTKGKAELEYLDPDCAKSAAMGLDGRALRSRNLVAQLDLRSAVTGVADLRSSTLKLSWFAPSRMAYAHYGSIHEAKRKTSELNGKTFASRKLSTNFQPPSFQQKTNFTVIVKSLPLHFQLDALKKFCSTNSVKIGDASYHGKEGNRRVEELLKSSGPLESIDYSHPSPKDLKVKALVRFTKPEHAAAAAAQLQGQSQSFLGGAKIWVTRLHSIKYNLPKAQFSVLADDLSGLQGADDHSAKVRIFDKDESGRPADVVCIRIYGEDPKALGRLKLNIEALLSGEDVMHEGTCLWDDFFLHPSSQDSVQHVEQATGAFIHRDFRRRKLRVSGSRQQKDHVQVLLLRKIQELEAQRHHLPLTKRELGRLLQGEFAQLQSSLGEDKLSLDVRKRILVVRGDEEEIQAARLCLKAADAGVSLPTIGDASDCPVCFCKVTNPVKLTCGHSYCFACLRHYLASAETFPVKCIGEEGRCDLLISLPMIRNMLSPADETKLFNAAFLAHIHQNPNQFKYCPTADCQQIYRPTDPGIILRCPSCLARVCSSCQVEWHEGLTCAEHRDNVTGGEEAFRQWKEANHVQACPNCKADIEKSYGCNHMTCIRCNTHMCWVCRKTFLGKGHEIYDHMQAAHGGIGIEVDDSD